MRLPKSSSCSTTPTIVISRPGTASRCRSMARWPNSPCGSTASRWSVKCWKSSVLAKSTRQKNQRAARLASPRKTNTAVSTCRCTRYGPARTRAYAWCICSRRTWTPGSVAMFTHWKTAAWMNSAWPSGPRRTPSKNISVFSCSCVPAIPWMQCAYPARLRQWSPSKPPGCGRYNWIRPARRC